MSKCGKEVHLGKGTFSCGLEDGHESGGCVAEVCGTCRHHFERPAPGGSEWACAQGVVVTGDADDGCRGLWERRLPAAEATIDVKVVARAAHPRGTSFADPVPDYVYALADGHGADDLEAGTKDCNPKDAIGSTKLPLHLVPELTVAYASLGHLNGALKYGKVNWREAGVRSSIYIDAAKRHLDAFAAGEECDSDDGVPHLSAILACIGIILDARAAGKLTDDRCLPNPGYRATITELTSHVKRLQTLHKDKSPKHFTISNKGESK